MAGQVFHFRSPADYARVRAVFQNAGYTDQQIVEVLGTEGLSFLGVKRIPPLLRRTAGGSPLETLVRLFILGASEPLETVRRALAPMTPAQWAELGLLEVDGDSVRAAIQLRCYDDLMVAWDFSREARGVLNADYVMGISPSSLTLSGLTIRRPITSTLDLGTGSGFQAMLAAKHSKQVLATDLNPRAVEIADFNARLNDLDNMECKAGDLFEPAEDRKFDLIVSNPPFIISPENRFFFLHSGLKGDEVCRTIARQAPRLLNDGGYCQFMVNWTVLKGVDWRERLADWFEGSGCDAWVMHRGTNSADEYAGIWIESDDLNRAELTALFNKWMDYYESEGIEAIGSGLVIMRRAGDHPNWVRIDDAPPNMAYSCGEDVERCMRAQDFLNSRNDEALLDASFVLAKDARFNQESRPGETGWEPIASTVRLDDGLQYVGAIDSHGAALIGRCDGRTPFRVLLEDLAAAIGSDLPTITPDAAAIVRRLVSQGFLVPVSA